MRNSKQPNLQHPPSSRWANVLWLGALCVLILRSTYTESADIHTTQAQFLSNPGFSLVLSSVLLAIFATWYFIRGRRISYHRQIGLVLGVFFLVCGGLVALAGASDKRVAINDIITLAAPMLCGIALVSLLDKGWKIRVTLLVVCGLGVLATSQCVGQWLDSNDSMIQTYELDPDTTLSNLQIEPGTLQQMLFEHRLYSKDINGFFTTSNSAATFLLMCLFSSLALIGDCFRTGSREHSGGKGLLILAGLVIFTGLLITKSKGGILALTAAGAGLAAVLLLGKYLWKFRWVILVAGIATAAVTVWVTVQYGQQHGRLPGGNSMLVRWQYWETSGRIIKDYPLGTGPGNYYLHYTTYKDPGAVEEVRDPHNFVISLLAEYGPVGLLGFLAGAVIPLGTWVFKKDKRLQDNEDAADAQTVHGGMASLAGILAIGAVLMLVVRPVLFPMAETSDQQEVNLFAFFLLYAFPWLILTLALFLLFRSDPGWVYRQSFSHRTSVTCLTLGIAGVFIHNLIDYAIFEPANLTLFWILVAICIRLGFGDTDSQNDTASRPPKALRWTVFAAVSAALLGAAWFGILPTVRSGRFVQKAFADFGQAETYLTEALNSDPLAARPAVLLGSLYEQKAMAQPEKSTYFLRRAHEATLEAIGRNPGDHRNYKKLADICIGLAASDAQHPSEFWYQKALEQTQKALTLYPGSDRHCYQAGQLAEKLEQPETALAYYLRAVEIEDAFRRQFREMYPGEEVFSRMGRGKYLHAKEQIEALKNR